MPKLTQNQCDKALKLAQSILERLESGYLTRVPLLHLDELPAIPGVYFATTEDGEVLYVGKANNLATRCKISIHHKLPAAIEKGAAFLHIAGVPIDSVWYVEQVLIERLSPVLNRRYSRWWGVSMSENVTARDFANLELSTIDFLNSGKTFTSEAAEVQKFFAFAKQYKGEYKAYYGLTITEKTSAMVSLLSIL